MPSPIAALIAELQHLDQLPLERQIPEAKRLSTRSRSVIGAFRDSLIYQATRSRPQPEVAAALGLSLKTVEKAVANHTNRRPVGSGK
jgi:hypothetical protein